MRSPGIRVTDWMSVVGEASSDVEEEEEEGGDAEEEEEEGGGATAPPLTVMTCSRWPPLPPTLTRMPQLEEAWMMRRR